MHYIIQKSKDFGFGFGLSQVLSLARNKDETHLGEESYNCASPINTVNSENKACDCKHTYMFAPDVIVPCLASCDPLDFCFFTLKLECSHFMKIAYK